MKLNEAIQIVSENYKVAHDLITQVYVIGLAELVPNPEHRVIFANRDVGFFKEESSAGRITNKDISPWIRKANTILQIDNRITQQQQAKQFYRDFSEVIRDAQDKIPEYDIVARNGMMRVTHLENFAAVKKLCGRMRVCIRSSESDFEKYSTSGVLLLFEFRGRKFIFEYDKRNDDGTFWDERNEEMTPEEFFREYDIRELPRLTSSDKMVRDAFDVLDEVLYFNSMT